MLAFLWTAASCLAQSVLEERSDPSLGSQSDGRIFNGTAYSVIIEAVNHNPCSHFAVEERVRFFTGLAGKGRVASVQFTPHLPDADEPLTLRDHPDGVGKRVRMVFISDAPISPYPDKVRHKEHLRRVVHR